MEQLIMDVEHWAGHRERLLILRYIHLLGIPIHKAGDGSRINLNQISPENYEKIYNYSYEIINPLIEEFRKEIENNR